MCSRRSVRATKTKKLVKEILDNGGCAAASKSALLPVRADEKATLHDQLIGDTGLLELHNNNETVTCGEGDDEVDLTALQILSGASSLVKGQAGLGASLAGATAWAQAYTEVRFAKHLAGEDITRRVGRGAIGRGFKPEVNKLIKKRKRVNEEERSEGGRRQAYQNVEETERDRIAGTNPEDPDDLGFGDDDSDLGDLEADDDDDDEQEE